MAPLLVQPALFEAFGLTVIEAMTCGLPTFATCHGGPREVIENGASGFHIDPYHGAEAADLIAGFFKRCAMDDTYWDKLSRGAIERIKARYEPYHRARIASSSMHASSLESK